MKKISKKAQILAIFLIFLLSGCMTEKIDIEEATELCSDNGGWVGIRRDIFNSTTVIICANGAKFYRDR